MKCPKCSHEWDMEDKYFQICFDYIAQRFPLIHTANTSIIHQWKQAGYDFEAVIKPAVDKAVKSGKNCGLGYINAIIQHSLNAQVKPVVVSAKISSQKTEEVKMWKKRMGIWVE